MRHGVSYVPLNELKRQLSLLLLLLFTAIGLLPGGSGYFTLR